MVIKRWFVFLFVGLFLMSFVFAGDVIFKDGNIDIEEDNLTVAGEMVVGNITIKSNEITSSTGIIRMLSNTLNIGISGILNVGFLTFNGNSITSTNGTINFMSEDLYTTGRATSGDHLIGTPSSQTLIFQPNVYGDSFGIELDADGDGAGFLVIQDGTNALYSFFSAIIRVEGATGSDTTPSFILKQNSVDINSTGNNLGNILFKGLDSGARVGSKITSNPVGTWTSNTNNAPSFLNFFTQSGSDTDAFVNPAVVIDDSQDLVVYNNLAFGSGKNSTIIYDGTNLVFNTTNGIAWFSSNISAESFNVRSWIYDKSLGSSLDYARDSDSLRGTDGLNDDSLLPGFEQVINEITDYSRPVTVFVTREVCESDNEYGVNVTCSDRTYEVITYPHKKIETGWSVAVSMGLQDQQIYELLQMNLDQQNQIDLLEARIVALESSRA